MCVDRDSRSRTVARPGAGAGTGVLTQPWRGQGLARPTARPNAGLGPRRGGRGRCRRRKRTGRGYQGRRPGEHGAARGIVINVGTLSSDELVTFRAGCLDRAVCARIYTLSFPDELNAQASATSDLVRLCRLLVDGRDGQIDFEESWREPGPAI